MFKYKKYKKNKSINNKYSLENYRKVHIFRVIKKKNKYKENKKQLLNNQKSNKHKYNILNNKIQYYLVLVLNLLTLH